MKKVAYALCVALFILLGTILLDRAYSKKMYRGFMLDVARQFFPVSVVLAIIDELSLNNYTHLHLGLSNNERFSYLSYFDNGRLARANNNTKYYTKQNISTIVEYAKSKNIIVYGEIEFMGHALIWSYVYPEVIIGDEFNMSNPQTYHLLESVQSELIPLFTETKVWHMANDEVSQPPSEISKSLYFALDIANQFHKRPIIWDDAIYENGMEVSQEFVIQSWHNDFVNELTEKKYSTIISDMDYWYIGGSKSVLDYNISSLTTPEYIYGAELVWFTNETLDDPENVSWIFEEIQNAATKMNELEIFVSN